MTNIITDITVGNHKYSMSVSTGSDDRTVERLIDEFTKNIGNEEIGFAVTELKMLPEGIRQRNLIGGSRVQHDDFKAEVNRWENGSMAAYYENSKPIPWWESEHVLDRFDRYYHS